MIKNINIENFKGFEKLEITNCKSINVLVGGNGIGKSSILEAIFLTSAFCHPEMFKKIAYLRGVIIDTRNLSYLFYNSDFTNNIVLTIGDTKTIIKPLFTAQSNNYSNNLSVFDGIEVITTLQDSQKSNRYTFEIKEREATNSYDGVINLLEKSIPDSKAKGSLFIPSDKSKIDTVPMTNEIILSDKKNSIVKYLKIFDSSIDAVEIISGLIYIRKKGINKLIPINLSGDGIQRFMNIVIAILRDEKLILIDEIENGLHFTAHKKLWQAIIELNKITKAQFFITTHNEEMLESIAEVFGSKDYDQEVKDSLQVFSIQNTKLKGVQAFSLSASGIKSSLNMNFEIRN